MNKTQEVNQPIGGRRGLRSEATGFGTITFWFLTTCSVNSVRPSSMTAGHCLPFLTGSSAQDSLSHPRQLLLQSLLVSLMPFFAYEPRNLGGRGWAVSLRAKLLIISQHNERPKSSLSKLPRQLRPRTAPLQTYSLQTCGQASHDGTTW